MVLTTRNVVHYLLERGLLSRESVVDGDLWIVESTRRNRNYKVIRRQAPGYFVKQVQSFDQQAIASLRCESSCYWLAKNDADFAPLAPLLPAYHDFDANANVLVLGLLDKGESLTDLHRRTGDFSLESAESLARILATYHRGIPAVARKQSLEATFLQRVPWILSIDQFNPAMGGTISGGNTQIVGIIQRYPEFAASLETLRAQWTAQCLIHGDVKWDNCLMVPKEGNADKELKLIDWELSDFGDPCWDVGAVFQAYLSFWIFSMPAQADSNADELVARAQFPVEKMQPAMQHFWRAYAEEMHIPQKDQAQKLERSVRCAAARMIQTAYEYMYYQPQVSTNVLYLLQVSLNVLTRPQEAIQELLGFAEAHHA
jgi:thiamine kinase-like enzyme